jgi:hypothetical protein
MRRVWRTRPSPAIVVAVLALVAGVTGAAVAQPAAKKAVTKKKVKKIADKEIKKLAPGLSVANADTATNADSAANANALGGQPAGAYASKTSEPYREVGAPGQPTFKNGWVNTSVNEGSAAFYKDPLGVVHLKGDLANVTTNDAVAFTLPAGYRPSKTLVFPAAGPDDGSAAMTVFATGDVRLHCPASPPTCFVSINGLTFRAGA